MTLALIGFAVLLALSFMGFPLGFTTLVVGIVGFAHTRGWDWHAALTMMSQQIVETGGSYGLSVIPLFILMGVFIHRSNISEDLYRASYALVGKYKGGLAQSTVLACAGFAAVSGSSLATAATMAKVAMPHMRAYRYDDALSSGVVSAGGTLGILIPPSVPMVIYCLVAQEDVGKMFIAGVIPGILLTALFMVAVYALILRDPASGPAGEPMAATERWKAYLRVWPVLVLFVFILGGIYAGAFTPTEASGMGAVGAALFAFWRGRLRSFGELYASLIDACKTTAALFMVIFGAQVFANFINLSGLPRDLVNIVGSLQLSAMGVVLAVCAICIFLGMIFESVGLLLLIVPVFLPTLIQMNVDLIWFGIVMIVVVEMGLITPPIGMNVFVVKTVMPDVSITRIFAGVTAFVIADFVALALILAFPVISVGILALR
jgi:tripartite ATP-independent transporter DctM subunit